MNLSMRESRFIVWTLASFHTCAFLLAGTMYVYLRGDFDEFMARENYGSQETLIGLAAFSTLWAAALFGTWRALPRGLPSQADSRTLLNNLGYGALGGALTGGVFMVLVGIGVAPFTVLRLLSDPEADIGVPVAVVAGTLMTAIAYGIAGLVAWWIGGFIGIIAAVVDWSLLWAATRLSAQPPVKGVEQGNLLA